VLLLGTGSTWLLTRFAVTYLHDDPGFVRYFALSCVLAFGLSIVALADDLGFLFLGWELAGLSSFLLVAFFHQRTGPVRSSLRVFAYYRVGDAGLAVALAAMHAAVGTGAFEHVFVPGALGPEVAMIAVFGIMVAAAVKSAQLPFSAWLPAALEGPTTSSALFYGGVVTHLGALLLLRAAPLFGPGASAVVVVMGLTTAVAASVTARVQADVKSARAYGGLVHISLVIAEIGAGLTTLALVHLTANVLWRMTRLLWAPDAIGEMRRLRAREARPAYAVECTDTRSRWARRVWVFACERMHLDALADRLVVAPLLAAGRTADHWEQRLFGDEPPADPAHAEVHAAEASLSMLSSSGVVQR
jgi:NADH-quinone oxidoreductase subunit L